MSADAGSADCDKEVVGGGPLETLVATDKEVVGGGPWETLVVSSGLRSQESKRLHQHVSRLDSRKLALENRRLSHTRTCCHLEA